MGRDMGEDRVGDWIQTYTGGKFWPLDPRASDVCIEDIAHSLSMKCRYGGHCRKFYSVAEHSVLISRAVSPANALWGLLHDAGEAYLADIPRPVKPLLSGWRYVEARVMLAVCDRFSLSAREPDEVKLADHRILTDEKNALMFDGPEWGSLIEPLCVQINGWEPETARFQFMMRFNELMYPHLLPKVCES